MGRYLTSTQGSGDVGSSIEIVGSTGLGEGVYLASTLDVIEVQGRTFLHSGLIANADDYPTVPSIYKRYGIGGYEIIDFPDAPLYSGRLDYLGLEGVWMCDMWDRFARSVDDGRTWNTVAKIAAGVPYVTDRHGVVLFATENTNYISRVSTDYGENWSDSPRLPFDGTVILSSNGTALLLGNYNYNRGKVYRSTNRFSSGSLITLPSPPYDENINWFAGSIATNNRGLWVCIYGYRFTNGYVSNVTPTGYISVSQDDGATWSTPQWQSSPEINGGSTCDYSEENDYFYITNGGNIQCVSTDGAVWKTKTDFTSFNIKIIRGDIGIGVSTSSKQIVIQTKHDVVATSPNLPSDFSFYSAPAGLADTNQSGTFILLGQHTRGDGTTVRAMARSSSKCVGFNDYTANYYVRVA